MEIMVVKDADVVGESEATHFVIFDSHIASLLKCYMLSNKFVISEAWHD